MAWDWEQIRGRLIHLQQAWPVFDCGLAFSARRGPHDGPAEDSLQTRNEFRIAERPSRSLGRPDTGEALIARHARSDQGGEVRYASQDRRHRHQLVVGARQMGAHS